MNTYIIEYRTKPGMHSQYHGQMTVFANDIEGAFDNAWERLKRNSFPDYSRGMFKFKIVGYEGEL